MLAYDFIRKRNTIINSVLNGGALDKAYFAYASLCTQANMPPKSLEGFEEMCDDVHHMSHDSGSAAPSCSTAAEIKE